MPKRILRWANANSAITAVSLSTIVAVTGLLALNRESKARAADLRAEQAEDARVLAFEQEARDKAVIRICEIFAQRVEQTFHETYDALNARAIAVGRPAPAVYAELNVIAEKNMDPAFCSPRVLEEPPTTSP